MSEAGPKRFYADVKVAEADGIHVIELDGRPARTVGRQKLGAGSRALADAIAEEWEKQGDKIDLASMSLTRLQGFVLDSRDDGPAIWTETILSYLQTDLLCYRAPERELAVRQSTHWQPLLDEVGRRLGGVFAVTEGVMAVEQPAAITESAAGYLSGLSSAELYALKLLTEISGSAVIAIAIADGIASADDAFAAARLDETYQAEIWGIDQEAAEREAALRRDFDSVVRFLELTRA